MKKNLLLCLIAMMTMLVSCGEETKKSGDSGQAAQAEQETQQSNQPQYTPSNLPLPDACSLISTQDIQQIIGINAGDIQVKDGSNANSPHARACFFKWVGKRANAGMFIQVQKNPVGDEFPEWTASYVESKRSSGERDLNGGSPILYKKFDGLGDDGAYSYEFEKYIWRTGYDYVYTIAFNEDMGEAEQLKYAQQLGKKVMARVQ